MNKKGFMLAELVITATVVISAMVGLYSSFNKIYSLYKERNRYYNIDGIYATKEMTKNLLNNKFSQFDSINHFVNINLDTKHYYYIIENKTCKIKDKNNSSKEDPICLAIKDTYNIKNMIFAEYNKCSLSPTKCGITNSTADLNISNQSFKDYIDYVINYYDIESTNTSFNYIILTEREENSETFYSNLRIR